MSFTSRTQSSGRSPTSPANRRNASASSASACAPGRFPGACVEKWTSWRPSRGVHVSATRRTRSRVPSPRNDGASSWWKRRRRPAHLRAPRARGPVRVASARRSRARAAPRRRASAHDRQRSARPGRRAGRSCASCPGQTTSANSRGTPAPRPRRRPPRNGRREHRVLARMRRDVHPARAHQPPSSARRGANSSHHASSFAACEPNGIRLDVSRKTETRAPRSSAGSPRARRGSTRSAHGGARRDVRESQRPRRGRKPRVDTGIADAELGGAYTVSSTVAA